MHTVNIVGTLVKL